jgi:putative membrane protein
MVETDQQLHISKRANSMNSKTELSPTENLALIRTDLANERTLLAYGRTALLVAGTGVSLIKFIAESAILVGIGWALVVIGIGIGVNGATRFTKLYYRLHPRK